MPPRVRTPTKRLPIQLSIPKLAEAAGLSRKTMRRRLEEDGCPLRQRGSGTKRKHVFVTMTDLETHSDWILQEIKNWHALLVRAAPGGTTDEDD